MTGVAFFDIDSFQLEEGVVATEYERPAPTPDYPIEVKSLNDFDVVSSVGGRNLVLDSNNILMDGSDSGNRGLAIKEQDYISITPKLTGNVYANGAVRTSVDRVQNETYTVSLEVNTLESTGMYWYMSGNHTFNNIIPNTNGKWVRVSHTYTQSGETKDGNSGFLWGFNRLTAGKEIKYRNLKLEIGNTATDWAPAPEDVEESDNHPLIDKINILLDEPLRSVGDVRDRLFRDSDGLWKVERNVGEHIFEGNEFFSINPMTPNNRLVVNFFTENNSKKAYTYKTNMFPYVPNGESIPFSTDYLRNQGTDNYNRFWVYTNRFNTNEDVIQFFKSNPLRVLYDMHEPEIEILPMSTQDKLNNLSSFSNSNYVYTIDDNNISPNLNVVFKSKGWKHKQVTDRLETDVSNKADNSDVEKGFSDVNESIDEFRRNYESYQDSAAQSMENASNELQKALDRTSVIETNLGEGAADWIFTHTQIRMSDEGVTIGQKEAGSYLQISDNQISFFNGSEDPVAFINGGMLHINHAIFVESIQISEFMISSEISGHITFRYVGGS